jgi:hypothetical protein
MGLILFLTARLLPQEDAAMVFVFSMWEWEEYEAEWQGQWQKFSIK